MPRQKRTSLALEKAHQRATNLKSIQQALDLGSGLTLESYQSAISKLQTRLENYNNQLALLDTQANEIQVEEKALAALSERMLEGVSVKYGKDSNEYEQAGGVRKSERKKPVRKVKSA